MLVPNQHKAKNKMDPFWQFSSLFFSWSLQGTSGLVSTKSRYAVTKEIIKGPRQRLNDIIIIVSIIHSNNTDDNSIRTNTHKQQQKKGKRLNHVAFVCHAVLSRYLTTLSRPPCTIPFIPCWWYQRSYLFDAWNLWVFVFVFLFVFSGLHAPGTKDGWSCRPCWVLQGFLSISLCLVVDVVCRNIRRIGQQQENVQRGARSCCRKYYYVLLLLEWRTRSTWHEWCSKVRLSGDHSVFQETNERKNRKRVRDR